METQPPTPAPVTDTGGETAESPTMTDVAARIPQFAPLQEGRQEAGALPLDRFYDVNINVWVELGRVEMPIGEILQLGDGSVVKLERPVSQPVELVAQGVRLARGEVVVVDDCFAVRITEIHQPEAKTEGS